MKTATSYSGKNISLLKEKIFWFILVFLPFLIFFVTEIILRVSGYEDELNLVAKVSRSGTEYYTINQLVGKRYFSKERLYFRKGSHDYFEINKSPNTFRVFCFGASTTAGFPYEYNAIPSEFLRSILKTACLEKKIEVINTAIAATNSFTVNEFADELVQYKPDLFVVYMGQNEFYGVYGVESTISIGKNRWMIKTYLWLEKFKTFLLLKNAINYVTTLFGKEETPDNKILMEEMAKTSIRYNSDDYKTAVNTFRDNYIDLINTSKKNNIPIIISTLVTNENALPPFVSFNSENLSSQSKSEFDKLKETGLDEFNKGNYITAAQKFQEALSVDSIPADVHYQLGKCYENLNMFNEARKQYSLARDLDGLRFRAPGEFNNIIKNLGLQFNVPVADVQNQFRENSENGLIGSQLLVDHVHPNIAGYLLLAKTWFSTIKETKLLETSDDVKETDSLDWRQFSVTTLDSLIGAIKIMELRSRPPFSKSNATLNFQPQNVTEQVAYQYVVSKKSSWASSHMDVAKYYLSIGNFDGALNEIKAVLVSDDENPMILKLAGDMSLQLNKLNEAEKYYLRAIEYAPNQFIQYKLAKTELLLGKPSLAIQFFKNSLEIDKQSSEKFNTIETEDIYLNLSEAYKQIKDYKTAKEIIDQVLKLDPLNKKALELLKEIEKLSLQNEAAN
jgi:tetratricopeptide (TPR) repeat protein